MGDKRGGFQVEYAKSGRSACKGCGGLIKQDSMRIGKETRSTFRDGWDVNWYHYKCSPKFDKIADVKDYELLRWDDQMKIRKDTKEDLDNSEETKRLEKENRNLWELKDQLDGALKGPAMKAILEANGMQVDKMTPSRLLHKVADGMLFGYIGPCPECKNEGALRYYGKEYICKTGWISGFTKCEFKGTQGCERYKWIIPSDILKSNSFLKGWKYPDTHPTAVRGSKGEEVAAEEEEEAEEVDDGTPEDEVPVGKELYGMKIAVAGTKKDLGMTQDEISELIEEHGGDYHDDIYVDTTILICSEAELNKKKKTKKVTTAIKEKLAILSVDFLTNLTERSEEGIKLRTNEAAKKYLVGDSQIGEKRIASKYSNSKLEKEKEKEEKEKAKEEEEAKKKEELLSKKRKRAEPKQGSDLLKVDPKAASKISGPSEILVTHDDQKGWTAYNAMLNVSDTSSGVNKFYRLQVVRPVGKKSFYFFISWGRVGTDIGDFKWYSHGQSQKAAIEAFEQKFFDQTGNVWEDRALFVKKPGKYFMVDLDDGNEDEEVEEEIKEVKRQRREARATEGPTAQQPMETDKSNKPTLSKRTQDLVKLIFDKEMMKQQLQSLEVDIRKMPLGKIKKSQIKEAYAVLNEIQGVIEKTPDSKSKLQDCANRFYTLIPHDFGMQNPPLINNLEALRKKMDLLDALIDIEIANKLMEEAKEDSVSEDDPVYKNYQTLKAKIEPVEKSSDLYKLLESYAHNTHDKKYFSTFDLQVEDIFTIDREGEKERYKDWEKNENRMLLWHGSRLTNWCGIISQGLRIAPPEAPKTGYRFGKGVYFADVISKSGSYCFTSNAQPHAVMLLAEVAAGKLNELKKDEYMEKAPPGTQCTKALGMAHPDPKQDTYIPENVKVPCGKVVDSGLRTACSHNEYIIYDVSQIRIRYLVRLKFNHKNQSW
eukprot:TRINITY_DN1927_c0_g1_i1.p1 TRINITY_DN1927_c0_g1~~TRINITY_DN1927_c0_g1_i1.p1  ORF type:complete len:935 (-),score=347.88 TRINITY_DN1927_c0_g1_i1:64-2868(-)